VKDVQAQAKGIELRGKQAVAFRKRVLGEVGQLLVTTTKPVVRTRAEETADLMGLKVVQTKKPRVLADLSANATEEEFMALSAAQNAELIQERAARKRERLAMLERKIAEPRAPPGHAIVRALVKLLWTTTERTRLSDKMRRFMPGRPPSLRLVMQIENEMLSEFGVLVVHQDGRPHHLDREVQAAHGRFFYAKQRRIENIHRLTSAFGGPLECSTAPTMEEADIRNAIMDLRRSYHNLDDDQITRALNDIRLAAGALISSIMTQREKSKKTKRPEGARVVQDRERTKTIRAERRLKEEMMQPMMTPITLAIINFAVMFSGTILALFLRCRTEGIKRVAARGCLTALLSERYAYWADHLFVAYALARNGITLASLAAFRTISKDFVVTCLFSPVFEELAKHGEWFPMIVALIIGLWEDHQVQQTNSRVTFFRGEHTAFHIITASMSLPHAILVHAITNSLILLVNTFMKLTTIDRLDLPGKIQVLNDMRKLARDSQEDATIVATIASVNECQQRCVDLMAYCGCPSVQALHALSDHECTALAERMSALDIGLAIEARSMYYQRTRHINLRSIAPYAVILHRLSPYLFKLIRLQGLLISVLIDIVTICVLLYIPLYLVHYFFLVGQSGDTVILSLSTIFAWLRVTMSPCIVFWETVTMRLTTLWYKSVAYGFLENYLPTVLPTCLLSEWFQQGLMIVLSLPIAMWYGVREVKTYTRWTNLKLYSRPYMMRAYLHVRALATMSKHRPDDDQYTKAYKAESAQFDEEDYQIFRRISSQAEILTLYNDRRIFLQPIKDPDLPTRTDLAVLIHLFNNRVGDDVTYQALCFELGEVSDEDHINNLIAWVNLLDSDRASLLRHRAAPKCRLIDKVSVSCVHALCGALPLKYGLIVHSLYNTCLAEALGLKHATGGRGGRGWSRGSRGRGNAGGHGRGRGRQDQRRPHGRRQRHHHADEAAAAGAAVQATAAGAQAGEAAEVAEAVAQGEEARPDPGDGAEGEDTPAKSKFSKFDTREQKKKYIFVTRSDSIDKSLPLRIAHAPTIATALAVQAGGRVTLPCVTLAQVIHSLRNYLICFFLINIADFLLTFLDTIDVRLRPTTDRLLANLDTLAAFREMAFGQDEEGPGHLRDMVTRLVERMGLPTLINEEHAYQKGRLLLTAENISLLINQPRNQGYAYTERSTGLYLQDLVNMSEGFAVYSVEMEKNDEDSEEDVRDPDLRQLPLLSISNRHNIDVSIYVFDYETGHYTFKTGPMGKADARLAYAAITCRTHDVKQLVANGRASYERVTSHNRDLYDAGDAIPAAWIIRGIVQSRICRNDALYDHLNWSGAEGLDLGAASTTRV
jgi:hypothetical protein